MSSAFPIPVGASVDLAIGVSHRTLLSARGKVVCVQPKIAGNFSVAIAFECLSVACVPYQHRDSESLSAFGSIEAITGELYANRTDSDLFLGGEGLRVPGREGTLIHDRTKG